MDCLQLPFIRVEEDVSWTNRSANKEHLAQQQCSTFVRR